MTQAFDLSRFLPYQLAFLSERVSRRLSEDYQRSHGLSVADWRVLVHLQRCGTASVRDIQEYTNLEKSRVSRAVSRLESAGLLAKSTDGTDARLVEISLTSSGKHILDEVLPAATQVERTLLKGVSPEDVRVFYDVIEHFHSILDADPKARPRPALDYAVRKTPRR